VRTCLALTSAVGGALLAAIIALPAYGASAPTAVATVGCAEAQVDVNDAVSVERGTAARVTEAQNAVNADRATIAKDQQILASDTATDEAKANAQTELTKAQAALVTDNQRLIDARNADATARANITAAEKIRDAACATPTTTPVPTTTPAQPPVGVPAQFGNCAQALRFGYHDIPRTDPRYRPALDRDRDGIACEITEGPPPAPPVVNNNTTINNPPTQNTVINPAPAFSNPGPVIIVPPAPTPNIVTGNLPVTH
jgi:Excalibur calcium-binding domain